MLIQSSFAHYPYALADIFSPLENQEP